MISNRLSARLVVILVGLVVITAFAIGVPAILLINRQLDAQFWERVTAGEAASQALLSAEERDINGLAQLTAQRPTLRSLLLSGEFPALEDYLATLGAGAELDMLVLCDPDGVAVAETGSLDWHTICALPPASKIASISVRDASNIILIGASSVQDAGENLGRIVVGRMVDQSFARALRDRTGMEHFFWTDGQLIASSLDLTVDSLSIEPLDEVFDQETRSRFRMDIENVTYYASRQQEDDSGLVIDVALSAEALAMTRQRLELGWLGIMILVVAGGSLVGLLLSRQLGGTFNTLSSAAIALREGDLDTPVRIETDLEEATSVARALESARQALNETLHKLRQEKQWSDQLLDSIVEGIVILDQKHEVTFFSSGAERISGWMREDVLSRNSDRFFRPIDSDLPFNQLLPRQGGQTTIHVEMAEGRQSILAISSTAFQSIGSDKVENLLVFRDVSEEQAVHRLMGHFMGNVSHEFRTPLSAIAASTELLIDQVDDLSSSELHELLSALHLGILKLSALVDNLLESASIETGQFRVTPREVDLGSLIGEAVETMRPLMDKHHQKLEIILPVSIPFVMADPRRTIQVLANLLSNASKFGSDASAIRIVARQVDGSVLVEVHDRGPGVSEEHRDYIFRRFSSVPQEITNVSYGVGLGLSVVKAIIEAQGGEVGVRENPEGGAIFWFSLPEALNA